MNVMPTVSVLMTAFNREKYIQFAIDSVLAQNFSDFELIIVDDCSTDDTVEIIRSNCMKDSRIKLFINEHNLGDYANRNIAAACANGKYLKYVDSDDYLYKQSLSIMVDCMEKFPTAAYAFSFRYNQIDQNPFPILFSPHQAFTQHFFKEGFFYAGPGSSIIRRDKFMEIGGFSGKQYVGDFELWMKLSSQNDCAVFQPGLLWWRKHEGHEFQLGEDGNHYLINNFYLVDQFLALNTCPLNKAEKELAYLIQKTNYIRNILLNFIYKEFKINTFYSLLRQYQFNLFDVVVSLFPIRIHIKTYQKKVINSFQ